MNTLSIIIQYLAKCLVWLTVVAPWEQAMRVRLGKKVKLLNAGWHVCVPFVDVVHKQSIRRRINIIQAQTLTTKDRKVVTCAGAVGYAIADLQKLYDTLESPNGTIEKEVAGLISQYIGENNLDGCSSVGMEAYVAQRLCLERYGLIGQQFYVVSFATTAKTYRLITGDMASWVADGGIHMPSQQSHGRLTA